MTDGIATGTTTTEAGTDAYLRAGLLRVEGRMLVADTRAGTLRVVAAPQQPGELVWTPAGSQAPEVRVALSGISSAAGPVVVERLPGPQRAVCVRQGGVRHAFFWLQDPATTEDADAQRIARLNAEIARLSAPEPAAQASFIQQLSALIPPETLTTPSVCVHPFTQNSLALPCTLNTKNVTPSPQQQQSTSSSSATLERYFQSVLDNRPESAPTPKDLDLEELLKPDNVWECIKDDAETQQALLPLLPEGTQTPAGLHEMVYSAQYRQTVQTLALVLQNGDAAPLLAEMRLPLDAQGPHNGITRFLTALMRKYNDSE